MYWEMRQWIIYYSKWWACSVTFPVQPVFALAVEQQLVVDIWQQELDTPALNTQLVLYQHNRTAVVAGLWTWDHTDLITEGGDNESEGWEPFLLVRLKLGHTDQTHCVSHFGVCLDSLWKTFCTWAETQSLCLLVISGLRPCYTLWWDSNYGCYSIFTWIRACDAVSPSLCISPLTADVEHLTYFYLVG